LNLVRGLSVVKFYIWYKKELFAHVMTNATIYMLVSYFEQENI